MNDLFRKFLLYSMFSVLKLADSIKSPGRHLQICRCYRVSKSSRVKHFGTSKSWSGITASNLSVSLPTTHRDLNFDSHKRFGTRDFAFWAYILSYGESKKDCLNSCRNKSSHTKSQPGIEPGTFGELLLDWVLLFNFFNNDFT